MAIANVGTSEKYKKALYLTAATIAQNRLLLSYTFQGYLLVPCMHLEHPVNLLQPEKLP